MWVWLSLKRVSGNALQEVVPDQSGGSLPLSPGLFHVLQRSVLLLPLDGLLGSYKFTVHGSSAAAFAWVCTPKSQLSVWGFYVTCSLFHPQCAELTLEETAPPKPIVKASSHSWEPGCNSEVSVPVPCASRYFWTDVLFCCMFVDHLTTERVDLPSQWIHVTTLDPDTVWCVRLSCLDSHNLDKHSSLSWLHATVDIVPWKWETNFVTQTLNIFRKDLMTLSMPSQ